MTVQTIQEHNYIVKNFFTYLQNYFTTASAGPWIAACSAFRRAA